MSLYVVGDIQGCYRELMQLLERVGFSFETDTLWCVGDIVARGPDSLDALNFFLDAPNSAVHTVLGNHDLNLIGVLLGQRRVNPKDRLDGIISSSRRLDYIDWLRHQPLMHHNPQHNLVISHAGLYPWWTLQDAKKGASDVEWVLKNGEFDIFIESMFGNKPDKWDSSLTGFDRYRFIVNAFTRMRYCTDGGVLDFDEKSHPDENTNGQLKPWFHFYSQPHRIAFGHWAALMGESTNPAIIGLDTGCVWGNHMTLWNVDNNVFYKQSAVS